MAKKKSTTKPKLHLCAAAWTLTGYPSPKKEWSVDTKVKRAAEAGFDTREAFIEHLRTDPQYYMTDEQEYLRYTQALAKEIDFWMPKRLRMPAIRDW